jgi:hypothetical protein
MGIQKDVAWYRRELSEETIGPIRPILESYSHVDPEDVVKWIMNVVSHPIGLNTAHQSTQN